MDLNKEMTSAKELYENGRGQISISNSIGWDKDADLAIINLDNRGNGTHWTSMRKIGKNTYDYDDSFGQVPDMKNLKLKDSIIFYDMYQEQDKTEKNCGARAFNSLFDSI